MPETLTFKHSHLSRPDVVLALEASCDETAASVVARKPDGTGEILSNIVFSQTKEHAAFGGVVPEIAARAHVEAMDEVVTLALKKAKVDWSQIDALAATAGPGLNGGLLVATMTAKTIATALDKPFHPINHLEGHALTARLTDGVAFPFLLLLVSGGHTQILRVENVGVYTRLATTIDDALGEAFDKTAKLLGLGYPGGPQVEKAARNGSHTRFPFPRPLSGKKTLDFSFSGLKTAVRVAAETLVPLTAQDLSDICASFQAAVVDCLTDRVHRAMADFNNKEGKSTLVVAGGVAANQLIRKRLADLCHQENWQLCAPPLPLCGDNAAMIAWAALERRALGQEGDLSFVPRPRWPLDESRASIGSGKKGAKV